MILRLLLMSCGLSAAAVIPISDSPRVFFNASVDDALTWNVYLRRDGGESALTAFRVYFTDATADESGDELYQEWRSVELLASGDELRFSLTTAETNAQPDRVYRLRAAPFLNHIEGQPTDCIHINTLDGVPSAPLIKGARVWLNSSVLIDFIPRNDIKNLTVEYRVVSRPDDSEEVEEWEVVELADEGDHSVTLDNLHPNRTYAVRLFSRGRSLEGTRSKTILLQTNNTAHRPSVSILEGTFLQLDPDVSSPVELTCIAISLPASTITWLVNDQLLPPDHIFYSVHSVISEEETTSTIRAKSRTRSDRFTCIAENAAGEAAAQSQISIRGPGAPPNQIVLSSSPSRDEISRYTVSWEPPIHPNGNITKYVVYYSTDKEEPLADWQKVDLDGDERRAILLSESEDGFFVRIQAASTSGPGIISDIVAIERDSVPIVVYVDFANPDDIEEDVIEPNDEVTVICSSKGKPRPRLMYTLSDSWNISEIEPDVWHSVDSVIHGDRVSAHISIAIPTSKIMHCLAKNSVGANSTSRMFNVRKPGDSPRDVKVASIDAVDVVIAWTQPLYVNQPIQSYDVLVGESPDEEEDDAWQIYTTNGTTVSIPTEQLKTATEYFIRARAVNAHGPGPLSEALPFTTPNGGPELPPRDLRIDINEANTAVLSWKAPNCSTKPTHYSIYFTRDAGVSDSEFTDWQAIQVPATETRHKFDHQVGLKPKTLYRVRVTGRNEVAEGPASIVKEFETAYQELPIPTDIQVIVLEDNTVEITFDAVRDPEDHSKMIEDYSLEMAANEDVLTAYWSPVKPSAKVVDTFASKVRLTLDGNSLIRNTKYWMKVTAAIENPTRLVQASKPRLFTTGDGKLRTKAEICEGSLIQREPNLYEQLFIECRAIGSPAPEVEWAWLAGAGLTGPHEAIREGEDGWSIRNVKEGQMTISTLIRDFVTESGRITCYAHNEEGNASATAQLKVGGPGSPPANIVVDAWRNYLNVSWEQPLIPNSEITTYIVYYTLDSDEELADWEKIETSDLSVSLPVIAPLSTHFLQLQSLSVDGPGIISDSVPVESDYMYEPLSVRVELEDDTILELSPGHEITHRCVAQGHPRPDIAISWYGTFEDSPTQRDHDENTYETEWMQHTILRNRTLTCRAVNKYEIVEADRNFIVRKPGDAPSRVRWEYSDLDDSVTLFWRPIQHPNSNNLSYNVHLGNLLFTVPDPPLVLTALPYNVNASVRVVAVNEWGEGESSEELTMLTPHGGPKTAPIIHTISSLGAAVTVTWSAPSVPNGIIQNYTLSVIEDGDETVIWRDVTVPADTLSYTLSQADGLSPDSTYRIRISSTNPRHRGPYSEVFAFDTFVRRTPDLPAPQNLSAILRADSSLSVRIRNNHIYKV